MAAVTVSVGNGRDQYARLDLPRGHGILVGQAGRLMRGAKLRRRQREPRALVIAR